MRRFAQLTWILALAGCGASSTRPAAPPPAPREDVRPVDADQDRVVEGDLCPDEPETYNGNQDEDGCPDAADPQTCVWVDRLQIIERVWFEEGSDRVSDASRPVIVAIADALRANPFVTRVAVVGGRTEEEPEGVAGRRADAVGAALEGAGVDSARLVRQSAGARFAGEDPARDRAVWFVIWRTEDGPLNDGELANEELDCEAHLREVYAGRAVRNCDCPLPGDAGRE